MLKWIVGIGMVATLSGCGDSNTPPASQANAQAPAAASDAAASPASAPAQVPKTESNWKYAQKEDQMRGKIEFRAGLESDNFINQDFPYEGDVHLSLFLLKRADGDKDVLFTIDKGQLPCFRSGDGCSFKAKFDNGPIQTIRAVGTSGGSDDVIFMAGNTKKFMASLRKAKKLTVEIDVYNSGNKQFTFSPAGLEWKYF